MAARCEMPEVPQHPSKAKKKMALCRGKGPARHRYPHEHRPTRWYPHNPARRLGPEGASERAPKKGDFSGACSKEEKTCGDCWETCDCRRQRKKQSDLQDTRFKRTRVRKFTTTCCSAPCETSISKERRRTSNNRFLEPPGPRSLGAKCAHFSQAWTN